jgi:phosphoenolpyruvate-protein kinase (PTS system EI component)
MASDPQALPIFLALGITKLSIAPASADAIRMALRNLDTGDCKNLLGRIANLHSAEEVRAQIELFLEAVQLA